MGSNGFRRCAARPQDAPSIVISFDDADAAGPAHKKLKKPSNDRYVVPDMARKVSYRCAFYYFAGRVVEAAPRGRLSIEAAVEQMNPEFLKYNPEGVKAKKGGGSGFTAAMVREIGRMKGPADENDDKRWPVKPTVRFGGNDELVAISVHGKGDE